MRGVVMQAKTIDEKAEERAVFDAERRDTHQKVLSFKLQRAYRKGERQEAWEPMNVHKSTQQPLIFGCNSFTINSLLFAGGNVGQRCLQILLDSGADLSVIRNDALDDRSRKSLTATSKMAIGANGLPLKVMGQVNIDICLGTFQVAHLLSK